MRAPLFLFWTAWSWDWPDLSDLAVEITFDSKRLQEADAVVFHVPELPQPRWGGLRKRAGQLWVAWSMESSQSYPLLADPGFLARFDLTMGYRQDATLWVPYFGLETVAELATPPVAKDAPSPCVYLQSSPHDLSGRADYARRLMAAIGVDSLGAILNTGRRLPPGREAKLECIRRYKFTLAFENSIATDYVTEKLFDPLCAGSVPVYLGAPNVEELAPADECFIDVSRFAGPEELADYLRALTADDRAYDAFLEWKRQPLRPSFAELAERGRVPPLRRLCEELLARLL